MRHLTQLVPVPIAVLSAVVFAGSRVEPRVERRAEPLIVDMDGNGYHLTTANEGVMFDLELTGTPEKVAWTAPGSNEAILAIDENHNGRIDSGFELVGGASGPPNGFEALIAYEGFATPSDFANASNRHPKGIMTRADAVFRRLLLWTDRNHNGVSEESELESLAHAGITAIYLGYQDISQYDSAGNLFHLRSRALLRNQAGVEVSRDVTAVRLRRLGE